MKMTDPGIWRSTLLVLKRIIRLSNWGTFRYSRCWALHRRKVRPLAHVCTYARIATIMAHKFSHTLAQFFDHFGFHIVGESEWPPRTRVPSQLSVCFVIGSLDQGPCSKYHCVVLQRRDNDWRPLQFPSILNDVTGCRNLDQPIPKERCSFAYPSSPGSQSRDMIKKNLGDKHLSEGMVLKLVWPVNSWKSTWRLECHGGCCKIFLSAWVSGIGK